MSEKLSSQKIAGLVLKKLIKEQFGTQDEFAYQYGADIRTISRYTNEGIDKISVLQSLSERFCIEFTFFFDENNT